MDMKILIGYADTMMRDANKKGYNAINSFYVG